MSRAARVGSVEMLKQFRVALCKFAETVTNTLDETDSEIRRTTIWLRQDQHRYWKDQLRKRSEKYSQAKLALKRKQDLDRTPLGGRYSYVDEKRAFAIAQKRLQEAEEKLENTRRWIRQLDQEAFSYKGLVQGLAQAVEVEIPNARAQIDRMTGALESYLALAPPEGATGTEDVAYPDGTVRGHEAASMARDAIWSPTDPDKTYQALRESSPTQALRDQTQVRSPACRWLSGHKINPAHLEAIAAIDAERTGVSGDDKIVVAKADGHHGRIYLERTGPCDRGDCGWYIGIADETEPGGYQGMRVADLLELRPDLERILTLPVGYLVVLDGGSVEAVVDGQSNVVWTSQVDGKEDGSPMPRGQTDRS